MKIILVIALLLIAYAAGTAMTAARSGSWLLVRDPTDPNLCAALDQDTGTIASRWRPENGRCSMRTFTWRRAFFVPDGWFE